MFAKERAGFLPALYLSFLDLLSQEDKDNFTALTSQEERTQFVTEHPFIKPKFDQLKTGMDQKDVIKSQAAREEGNALFQAGNFKQATLKYSLALAFSPTDKVDLSLAHANRSASLQRLNQVEKAIADVDLAIKANYPQDKLFKVYERKGQCLDHLGKYTECIRNLEKAKKFVSYSSLTQPKREKFINQLDVQIKKASGKSNFEEKEKKDDKEDKEDITERLSKVKYPNPLYPSLHKDIEVRFSCEQGRFTVAREMIPAGTVILAEDPLGWALDYEKVSSHCQNCLSPVAILTACPSCVTVAFCSESCQQAGIAGYHSNECGILGLLGASGINNFCLMGIRALARHGAKGLLDMKDDLEAPDLERGSTKTGMKVWDGASIVTGFHLVHHMDNQAEDELILRTLVNAFIVKCLRLTKFFNDVPASDVETDLYIAKLMYNFINACPANTHEIGVLHTPILERWNSMAEMKPLGSGLFPTAAMFNHSCDPNIQRCNIGRRMISVTCRKVGKGEEITDCYGLPWYQRKRQERQEVLSKFYKFSCICQACKEGWPTVDMLGALTKGDLTRLRCGCGARLDRRHGEDTVRCECGREVRIRDIPVDDIKSTVEEAVNLLTVQLDWVKGCEVLARADGMVRGNLYPPSIEYFNVQICVWRALWIIAGNKRLSKLF